MKFFTPFSVFKRQNLSNLIPEKIAILLLLFFSSISIQSSYGQQITFQLDGDRLYLSENGDCSGGPDPRWRLRATTQYLGWYNWNQDADDISGSWHNYTNYSWINNTVSNNNAILTVQLDAWEEDPAACDNPCVFCSNGGPDDGDCFGYATVSTRTMTDYAPCQWHYVQGTRNCTDDGVSITWGVEYSFYYTYNDLYPGSITGGGTYYSCDDPPAMGNSVSATKWATYQWQQSTNGGTTWTNIAGATGTTYNPGPLSTTTLFRRSATDCSGRIRYTNTITYTILNNGSPTAFGSNSWNVYCYNGRSLALSVTYRGYYLDNNLNINTLNYWGTTSSPSTAAGYVGCNVNIDNHTTVHKRQGFSCGEYRIDVAGHDDEIRIYVNGAQVYEYMGCCNAQTGVWTGLLNGSSTVEIRTAEGGGGSNTQVNFVDVTNSNGGSISTNQTICNGSSPAALSSAAAATGAGALSYQWQQSLNGSTAWINIGGATGVSYNPPATTNAIYYRRRAIDACGNTSYSNTITIGIHPGLTAGSITSGQTICEGSSPATLNSSANATGGNGFVYQWQQSLNGSTAWSNIGGATGATYNPPTLSQTTYYRRRAISNCGETLYSNNILITVNPQSTAPTAAAVAMTCPNTDVVLSASGGIAGTGSSIEWYADAGGTLPVGTGSATVTPAQTTTYYVRREGTCNSTALQPLTVNVRDYVYVPTGNHTTTNFCDDNAGWRHFYNASDEIILSVQGNFSGITSMEAVVNNNGSFFQQTENAPTTAADCSTSGDPGEERFELPRSWNINYSGTLNGTYQVRYYFPAAEKTTLETAAADYITNWPDCGYTYKYPYPNGFYWFKNTGVAYAAPQFEGTFLTATSGSVNGSNYSEIGGVTTFSGGTGAVILRASSSLPIELLSFEGENQGNYNLLRWSTASELNNDYFELERSTNPAEGFDVIARIDGAGTSSEIINYEHLDGNPASGTNYYRLKQTDFDGTISYSEVIALEVRADALSNTLFPNPTKGKVFYRINASVDKTVSLKIVNALGQEIDEQIYQLNNGHNQLTIDLSEYPSASYWIQLFGEDGGLIRTEIVNKVD